MDDVVPYCQGGAGQDLGAGALVWEAGGAEGEEAVEDREVRGASPLAA